MFTVGIWAIAMFIFSMNKNLSSLRDTQYAYQVLGYFRWQGRKQYMSPNTLGGTEGELKELILPKVTGKHPEVWVIWPEQLKGTNSHLKWVGRHIVLSPGHNEGKIYTWTVHFGMDPVE